MFLFELLNTQGLSAARAGLIARKMALQFGLHPKPLTLEFLFELAIAIANAARATGVDIGLAAEQVFDGVIERLEGATVSGSFEEIVNRKECPTASVSYFCHPLDQLLARHGLAPMPAIVIKKAPTFAPPERAEVTGDKE
jgi:hypothetical protein